MLWILIQLALWTALLAVLILWPAGTLAYPAAWVLLALFALGGLAMVLWLHKHSPRLLRERMASPLQREQKPWDRLWLLAFIAGFLAWIGLMGFDAARTGFTSIPVWLQAIGFLAILINGAGTWWTFRENSFAAPVVKIQEGQKVIDTGPYALVRHPMYTSTLFLLIGMPLLLGSWIGLILSAAFILGVAWRAVHEERTLAAELKGYDDYTRRVRWRLVPHIW
jgi:protein-S-isoprenylcysteine O-methyltransferase Ste14